VSVTMYRGLSLGLSFLPVLLYFTDWESFMLTLDYWPWLLLAAVITMGANVLSYFNLRRFPLGIMTSFFQSAKVMVGVLFGYWFFQEVITLPQIIGILIVLSGTIWLGLQRNKICEKCKLSPWIFVGTVTLQTVLLMGAAFMITRIARETGDPWSAGYLWEVGIGIFALIYGITRKQLSKAPIFVLSLKDFWKICLYASPTVLGTGAFFWASTLGPMGILSTVVMLEVVFSAFLGLYLYREKLSRKQIGGIILIITGIICLRILS